MFGILQNLSTNALLDVVVVSCVGNFRALISNALLPCNLIVVAAHADLANSLNRNRIVVTGDQDFGHGLRADVVVVAIDRQSGACTVCGDVIVVASDVDCTAGANDRCRLIILTDRDVLRLASCASLLPKQTRENQCAECPNDQPCDTVIHGLVLLGDFGTSYANPKKSASPGRDALAQISSRLTIAEAIDRQCHFGKFSKGIDGFMTPADTLVRMTLPQVRETRRFVA
jgi:hypothetical protein